jgi:diguanylate cyclase
MLTVGLLFGYGAGVAAGVALRPRIAVAAVLVAIVPSILVALVSADLIHIAAGALLAIFLAGGISSMVARHQITSRGITMRRTYGRLARQDDLTGMPNRLSLREAFEHFAEVAGGSDVLAVHCLDLDRFKPVNDRYGHPAGDALLCAVSERLSGVLRSGDIAARLGGDEFVILQTGARHPGEADLLARRIARAIAQPFSILGHQIVIGTSIGYALFPDHGRDLDDLIARADEALVRVKREGGGVAVYREQAPEFERRLSA